MGIQDAVRKLATDSGFDVLEASYLPGRTPSYADIPTALDRRVVDLLKSHHPLGGHLKTGHRSTPENRPPRVATETRRFYFVGSSVRKSVWTLVRQLRGPHFSTWA